MTDELIPGTEMLECGHMESPHSSFTRGYGRDAQGNRSCYDCCKASELGALKANRKHLGYLTRDTDNWPVVTMWPGQILMRVYGGRTWETSAGGFARRTKITRFYARDEFGQWWAGRGPGFGMYTRLTKLKRGPK